MRKVRHGEGVELPQDRPHGAYLRAELTSLMGEQALRTAVDNGLWLRFSRDVLVSAQRATEFATRAAAALLFAGPLAALTGQSALRLYGCQAADAAPIHLTVPYHRKLRSRPGVVVHQGVLDDADITEVNGFRTVVLDVALAEVLCRGSRHSAAMCADQVLAMLPREDRAGFRLLTMARVRERPDPRGTSRAGYLLGVLTGSSESPAESRTLVNLVDADIPVPVQQFVVTDLDGQEIYRLDFAWPELRVAVEYDGYEAHEARRDRDAARDEDLRRRGWLVIRADAADLRDPSRLVAAVLAAFRVRGLAA